MSTIGDKPLPTLRRKPTDSLGFTDFKLDPLQLNGTSHLLVPHQHREATRVFCLRLQPRSQTQLATTLKQFQDQTFLQCGPNQAHQSPPHLSLLGNISIDCDTHSSTARWHAVDMLVKLVDDEIQKALLNSPKPIPQPTFGGYTVKDKPTRSVNMRITLPRLYSRLSQELQQCIAKDYLNSHIRLEHPPSFLATRKSATSISSSVSKATTAPSTIIQWIPLAYNVLKSISRDDAVCIKALANDLINVNKWVNGKETSWELALHEIMLQSQAVGKTQQVTTIKTWSLDDNDDKEDKSKTLVHSAPLLRPAPNRPFTWTSFIPTSIRVKFSVLSSRFR
ncbi:hypothetical protein [Absidia glauca]|uniref:Uncharacterized protein n=1 Tax=Absidia glauca TaxID=4829 RepID=A0A170ANE0_ABSGL|nr:hypothetical protein [Absidia glauca]